MPRIILPDFGKTYTGPLLRDTHAGKTPPLFLWRSDTQTTESAAGEEERALSAFMRANGLQSNYEPRGKTRKITLVEYESRSGRALYLVNVGKEPAREVTVRVKKASRSAIRVYADTVLTSCLARERGDWTEIALPEFRSSCIVKVLKGHE